MNKVIVIVGPTGVGKTKMSIELAKKLDGEVINGDSTQIYKGLDIATAKVTAKEKEGIPHHLFDIREIKEDYSVYDYQIDCRNKIDELLKKGKTPIIVGGTGLYIKAALFNYNFSKDEVRNDYSDFSNEDLYKKLLLLDPNTDIHINNRNRVMRALDYYVNNTEKLSEKNSDVLLYDTIFIGLTTSRDILYDRINNRVDKMVEQGLINEAKTIYESNVRTKATMTPIGYKELFDYFDGNKTLSDCLDKIKQNSRRYAKRQYTFFNNQLDVKWIDVDFNCFDNTVKKALDVINN